MRRQLLVILASLALPAAAGAQAIDNSTSNGAATPGMGVCPPGSLNCIPGASQPGAPVTPFNSQSTVPNATTPDLFSNSPAAPNTFSTPSTPSSVPGMGTTSPGNGTNTLPGNGTSTLPGNGTSTLPGNGTSTLPGNGTSTLPGSGVTNTPALPTTPAVP